MIWLKEGKEEKETDLGLSLGEAGAERGRLKRTRELNKTQEREKKRERERKRFAFYRRRLMVSYCVMRLFGRGTISRHNLRKTCATRPKCRVHLKGLTKR